MPLSGGRTAATCPANLAFHRENWTPYRAATESPEFFPIRKTVDSLIAEWLEGHPRQDYQLLVLHTHSHDDQIAGDEQFADRPRTTVVPANRHEVYEFLGLTTELDVPAHLDLGGRVLECIASPGHDEAAVTFYDASTGLLLTGDTVYPGRLYVRDWPAFLATIDRLSAFADTHQVSHVLGCHIEMTTTPGWTTRSGPSTNPTSLRWR